MNSDWPLRKLGDITRSLNAKRVPVSSLERQKRQGSYRYYGASGVVDYIDDFIFDGTYLLVSEDGENLRTRNTPIAFKVSGKYWVNNHAHILDETEPGIIDFVEHAFRHLDISAYITGAVQPKLNKRSLEQIELRVPKLEERYKVNNLLGSLDNKIELNRQMNETLEEMARALFRDWFIDFGPTRRQMDGATDPAAIMGHAFPDDKAATLAPLFPATFSEGGLPEGWIKGILESIANSPRRGIHPTDVAENTPYIGLEHMPRRSIALSQWEGAGKVTSNKSLFKKGDLLFGKLRPYFHKVGRAPVDGICSTDIVVISPKSKEWDAFVTSCLSSDSFVEYTNKTSTGTRMPRTSWKIMAQYAICLPPEPIARAFQDTVEPLLDMVHSNIHETHTLAQIRDLLLPKLMSGEIQLKDSPMVQSTLDGDSR